MARPAAQGPRRTTGRPRRTATPPALGRGGRAVGWALAVGAVLLAVAGPGRPLAAQGPTTGPPPAAAPVDPTAPGGDVDLLALILAGGAFMVPIGIFSLLVVTFTVERLIALRRSRVLPRRMMRELSGLAARPDGFDPRAAFEITESYAGTAAGAVFRSMFLKAGRPLPEIEADLRTTLDREANRLYANVRWLSLAAAVTPLLGLLGTVWGLIVAFHDSTQLAVGDNRAENLAEGIYIALVTTLAGLIVAIAGATIAHLFEGRIQRLSLAIEEFAHGLLHYLEPFEGQARYRIPGVAVSGHPIPPRPPDDDGPPAEHEPPPAVAPAGAGDRVPTPPPPPEPARMAGPRSRPTARS